MTHPKASRRPHPGGKRRRPVVADPARRAAYDVLHEVGASDGYANLLLRRVLADHRLTGRDAAFTTELVMGTLRNRGTIDGILAACVDRPMAKLDPRVTDVLRLGCYQLLYLDTAAHAAVTSSVDLVGDVCGSGPRGLVNAVLRRVATSDLATWIDRITADVGATQALALRTSHPSWIISSLRDALGGDEEALAALLACNNTAPQVTLAARPGRITVAELEEQAEGETRRGRWSSHAVVLQGGRPGQLAAVRSQRAGVQDEGSQLMALLAADFPLDGRDERWLDLCAGPGGKASMLAALAAGRDARLLAAEISGTRAGLVGQALADAPGHHLVVQADGRSGPWATGTFDRILLDAPCTGLGVLRRRPESRWRRTPQDVAVRATLQAELLDAALAALRPGGIVAYVTCSPHIAETDVVVDRALASHAGEIVELDATLGLPAALATNLAPGPRVRLWPHLHGTDGMFAAVLQRC
ncbi:MAG: rRNA cytosine-C5-methyltransferase [Actinobacteria bacterium]|nr:rRNA cytosine-C5-methyltransferase [Actinomycetota bacterium]